MSKPVKIVLAVIGSLIVLAGIGYYALGSYADTENAAADPALTQQTEGAGTSEPAPEIDGHWSAASGSKAGYRVHETLNGKNVTVVGRTGDVTGKATAAGRTISAARMSVTLRSVHSNSKARDSYFRSEVVNVDKHPRATFTLTRPITVTPIAARTGQVSVTAHGTMQINGTKHSVAADVTVTRKAGSVIVIGAVPINWSHYGVTPPNLGFVQVKDHGQVEFRTVFTKS